MHVPFCFSAYEQLVAEGDFSTLAHYGCYDDRVFEVLEKYTVSNLFIDAALKNAAEAPHMIRCLSHGIYYPGFGNCLFNKFVPICSALRLSEGTREQVLFAELVSNIGMPEMNHLSLFNYAETFRHLCISGDPISQRAAIRCMAYMFADEGLGEAVSVFQYKTDVLNHVNNIYVKTADFSSWRFAVRVMSLSGGYNEDRGDVEYTEALVRTLDRGLPEFLTYAVPAYFYARLRHRPPRIEKYVPWWLLRRRAALSAATCGVIGAFYHVYSEHQRLRLLTRYGDLQAEEFRKRRGAKRSGREYSPNQFFDSLEGITRRMWLQQIQHWAAVVGMLGVSCLPLRRVKFPRFMGDVHFRHPWVAKYFPVVMGQPSATRAALPFVVVPFLGVSAATHLLYGVNFYDYYLTARTYLLA